MLLEMAAVVLLVALWVALGVDRWLGEPPVRYHPVVWMGHYLGWAGRRVQRVARQGVAFTHRGQAGSQPDHKAFWLAALVWSAGAAMVLIISGALQLGLLALSRSVLPWLGGAMSASWVASVGVLLSAGVLGLLLKPLLAWAMLKSEVLAVEAALNPAHGGALAAGRERLSWLVSRDVSELTEAQVRESAIESLAENLNDSVVAPLFWFVLLGLPGAALYRFTNTADAMWGYPGVYKGHNWQWAGKWAAHADDVLSWVPARLTAVLLALGAGYLALYALRREAAQTPSPNSGWPMAAMALALGVCLQKPGVYALNVRGREVQASDVPRAIKYASNVLLALMGIALAAIVFMTMFGSCSHGPF